VACAIVSAVPGANAGAAVAKKEATGLDRKQFAIEELSLSSPNVPLQDVIERLPNRVAWEGAESRTLAGTTPPAVFVDVRSGAATNILDAVPLLPGDGAGNRITLAALAERLGRPVSSVDAAVVADAVLAHVRAHRELLGIDVTQLGPAAATRITPQLWQISIPQQHRGVRVRFARVSATVSHGNLVSMGARTWGNVALDTTPRLSADDALAAGFAYAEGRTAADVVTDPRLEIVPVAPPEHQSGTRFDGPIGEGYRHRLVWTFEFSRPPGVGRWEVTVDAHGGEVIAFGDVNHYATRKRMVSGGVYPLADTGNCTDLATCGAMQAGAPMPFAAITDASGATSFANAAGVYDYEGGTTTTLLRGARLHNVFDRCGSITKSSAAGALALGGVNGQHDCASGGGSPGDTAAARTAYYEVNRISEIAAGYLPGNTFIRGFAPEPSWLFSFSARTNIDDTCNAYYQRQAAFAGELGFFGSGGGCRNTGELADAIDHEWGHFLDDHDANLEINTTGEGYADIAALYRTQQSCQGPGFFVTNQDGCGASPDGTGANSNEASAGSYCTTACSGVRDSDWVKHSPSIPADPLGFVCARCEDADFGYGPCGKEVHCGATPVSQAAWDLVARDLQAPPLNLDSQTAFVVGNKLFYQGSQNVGEWFSCECNGAANGCATDSGYMQWLFADDDNGSLQDGTPHMTAIFDAFQRHGIACASPTPRNGGCTGGPTAVPNLTVTPGAFRVALSWTAVPNATRYWVYRSEGHAGCNYGKALVAEVTGLSYADTQVAAGRPYFYNVVAAGTDSACFGRLSPCMSATPGTGNFTISCTPTSLFVPGSPLAACTVQASGGFSGQVDLSCSGLPSGAQCHFSPASVLLPADGSASTTLAVSNLLAANGTYAFKANGGPPVTATSVHQAALTVAIGPTAPGQAMYDAALGAPRCGHQQIGSSCDTGAQIVRFRDGIGPEPNQPNTLDGCADGVRSSPGGNGSIDRIRLATTGGTFAPGRKVVVTANLTATSAFSGNVVDFFFAADATQPVWVPFASLVPSGPGAQVLEAGYLLPAGALQAVRVQLRVDGTPPCAAQSSNDADDLVFAVGN
jgi:hypothetical protein